MPGASSDAYSQRQPQHSVEQITRDEFIQTIRDKYQLPHTIVVQALDMADMAFEKAAKVAFDYIGLHPDIGVKVLASYLFSVLMDNWSDGQCANFQEGLLALNLKYSLAQEMQADFEKHFGGSSEQTTPN